MKTIPVAHQRYTYGLFDVDNTSLLITITFFNGYHLCIIKIIDLILIIDISFHKVHYRQLLNKHKQFLPKAVIPIAPAITSKSE